MAGPPNGNVRSLGDAKTRLLELGRVESPSAKLFGSPAVRAGALLVAGALLGRMLGRRGKDGAGASFRGTVMRAGLAAAPLLVEQFIRALSERAVSHNGRCSEPSRNDPDRL